MIFFVITVLCIVFPELSVTAAREAILLWYKSVLPVLFTFTVLSRLTVMYGSTFLKKLFLPFSRLFALPEGLSLPFAISILCGTGSKTVCDCISDKALREDGLNVCCCASPVFVIGTVGTTLLNNKAIGIRLWIIQLCSMLILASFYPFNTKEAHATENSSKSLGIAIKESVNSVLTVCGYMMLFRLIIALLNLYALPAPLNGLLAGFFELTAGIKVLAEYGSAYLYLIAFLISFGGISVISQCLSPAGKVNKLKFILLRIISGAASALLCFIYEKTAISVVIAITVIAVIISKISTYLLKAAVSSSTWSSRSFNDSLSSSKTPRA